MDIKNSLSKILNERLTSPFYGTFILTWLIWNWKIIYLTIFISEDQINTDKISYIVSNFSKLEYLIVFPLISTLVLITIFPFITNRAYWISLLYDQWKIKKRNEVQKKELLTLEQSINIREQIKSQEKRFEELLEDKNLRIKQLESKLDTIENSNLVSPKEVFDIAEESVKSLKSNDAKKTADLILNDNKLLLVYEQISFLVQRRKRLVDVADAPSTKMVNFFITNDIIENDEAGKFNFTEFGKKVGKIIFENKK